jgi:hypothetical protein
MIFNIYFDVVPCIIVDKTCDNIGPEGGTFKPTHCNNYFLLSFCRKRRNTAGDATDGAIVLQAKNSQPAQHFCDISATHLQHQVRLSTGCQLLFDIVPENGNRRSAAGRRKAARAAKNTLSYLSAIPG